MLQSAALPKIANPTSNRACQNCARAKAKCTPQADGASGRCSRCFRLKKECVVLPRSTRKRRSPNTTNTAQLEEKIESLVTLLAAAHGTAVKPDILSPQSSEQTISVQSTPPVCNPTPGLWGNQDASWNGPSRTQSQLPVTPPDSTPLPTVQNSYAMTTPLAAPRPVPQPSQSYSTANFNIPAEGEEGLLRVFREQFLTRFPFIIIPPDITASELRVQKPFLHRVIMTVASEGRRVQQIEMSKQISMDIAAALIVRGERSLDMLQALVIYNAWSYYYSPVTPQVQSTAMFQLSFALIFDLGLNRPVRENDGPEILVDPSKSVAEINPREAKRTLDERRAFLSCYILTSCIAMSIKKTDGIQYSSYMDYNCKVLESANECETDQLLVAFVRLQVISESYHRNVLSKSTESRGSDDLKTPSWMYVKAFRKELQDLWKSFPPNLQQNDVLIMNYHSTEIFLYEVSLHANPISIGFSTGSSQRMDMLHACLVSAKSLLDLCLAQPLSTYHALSVIELSHIGQGLATIFKLSLIDVPGWDLSYVRKTISTCDYFDRLIGSLDQVGSFIDQSQPEPCRNSFPTGCANAMRRIKGVYEAKIAAEQARDSVVFEGISIAGDQMDWLDDAYWQELLNDSTFLQ